MRMQGATPPNVYNLTLRERLFHGVRAIRLSPVDGSRMYGRAGILAHPYMLGANGQSNGCVSLSDYPEFLNAFLRGEVTRLVVVERLESPPGKFAAGQLADHGRVEGGSQLPVCRCQLLTLRPRSIHPSGPVSHEVPSEPIPDKGCTARYAMMPDKSAQAASKLPVIRAYSRQPFRP